MEDKKERVIIDTDPGVDDAMAIVLALGTPSVIVEGLTIVHGNSTDVEKLGRNACAILEQAGRSDIPVHIGSHTALTREDNEGAEFVHGLDCLGDIEFPNPNKTPHPHHNGVQFIINKVLEYPNEITLIALGPLTNIALALKLFPDLPKFVKDIIIMGGNVFVPGNMSPVAEANIYSDPEAARIVFKTKWPHPITVAALDITEKLRMSQLHFDELAALNNTGKFINLIVKFCQKWYLDTLQSEDFPVHDATAVMALIRPDIFTSKLVNVDVETKGELTRAMLVPYPISDKKPANIKLLTDADFNVYVDVYRKAVATLPYLLLIYLFYFI